MTLPTSGPLTLQDIQGEFGGSNPISLNEYYAGGGLVPAGTIGINGAVPSSGQISIWHFYGTSAQLVELSSRSIIDVVFGGTARGEITITTGGDVLEFTNTSGSLDIGDWVTPKSGSVGTGYQIRATLTSGTTPSGSAMNTWLGLGSNRSWFLERTTTGTTTCQFSLEIRDATSLLVLTTALIDIEVTVN